MTTTYMIFAGETYYPNGGMKDFYDVATTLQEASAIFNEALMVGSKRRVYFWGKDEPEPTRDKSHLEGDSEGCDWAHVVDLRTNTIVLAGHIEYDEYEHRTLVITTQL